MKNILQNSPEIIAAYKEHLAQVSPPATAERKLSSLRRFYDFLHKTGKIEENPLAATGNKQSLPLRARQQALGTSENEGHIQTLPSTPQDLTSNLQPLTSNKHFPKKFFLFGGPILTLLIIALAYLKASDSNKIVPFDSTHGKPANNTVISSDLEKTVSSLQGQIKTLTTKLESTTMGLAHNLTTQSVNLSGDAPTIEATAGALKISGQSLNLQTAPLSDGNIQIAPDGLGQLQIRSSTTSQNSIDIRNANLTTGSLIYGNVGNNGSNYDFLRFTNGPKQTLHFSVDANGNVYSSGQLETGADIKVGGNAQITGSLNTLGDLQTQGLTRLTATGSATNITGYSQTSGNFTIVQGASDSAKITKEVSSKADLLTLRLAEKFPQANSKYDTLVLERVNGGSDAYALHVKEGNIKLEGYVDSNLTPLSNDVYDLGTSSLRWRKLWAEDADFSDDVTIGDALTVTGSLTVSGTTLATTGNIETTGNLTVDGNSTLGNATTDATTINGNLTANLPDNTANALDIQQGTDNYININTINSSENISFGNATINPSYSFLGSGTTTFSGGISVSGTTSLTGDVTLTGDLAVNGGDITTTSATFNLVNAATTLNIGSTNVTRAINIGTGTAADTINIGTGGTTADDINLGGLTTSTIDVLGVTKLGDGGSSNYAQFSATGDLTFVGTGDTITGPGAGGLTITNASGNIALSTTTSGNITATTGAATGLFNILTGNLKVGSGTPGLSLDGNDAYITGTLEVDGNANFGANLTVVGLTATGNVDLGTNSSNTITFLGVVDSNIVADASSTRNLGSSSVRWATGYFDTIDATTLSGTVSGGSTTSASWTVNSDNATNDAEVASLAFETGSGSLATFNAVLQWNASGDPGRVDATGAAFNDYNLFNFPIGVYSQRSGSTNSFTGGSIFKFAQPTSTAQAITQASAFLGLNIDFSTQFTVPNTSSGNQTGALVTLLDGGASATAIGFQTAGTMDYGLDIGGTIGTNDIRLSNAETINNTTNGTLAFGIDGTNEVTLTTTNFSPASAQGNSLGSSSLEWEQLFLGDDNGINFGLDDDFTLGYDETTDDRLELTASAKNFAIALTTGAVIISGNAEGTTAQSITAGDLVITDGDLTISGGEISATSDDATGTSFSFTTGALTTGTGVGIASTSQVITSGGLLSSSLTSSSATASFTGDIGALSSSRTNATAAQTLTDTGNILDLSRTTITNNGTATTNVTGPILNITNTATQTLGTLSDSANLVVVTQDADATGALLHLVSNRSSTNYSLLIEQTSGGTDTLSLTDAGNLAINGDMTITGNDLTFGNGESFDNNTDGTIDVNASILNLGNNVITNIGNASTDFDTSGGLTLAGNLVVNGDTDIGNAATDTLTITSSLDASLNFLDASTGTAYSITGSDATGATNAGGNLTITSGAGNTSGAGGTLALTGGAGGATGTGGAVNLTSGGSTTGTSGGITLQIGTVGTSGNAGALQLLGTAGVGGGNAGTTITLTAGNSLTSANGGGVTITGGNNSGGAGGGTGGPITISGGNTSGSNTTGNGGAVGINGGTASGSNGGGGAITLTAGNGGNNGSVLTLNGGGGWNGGAGSGGGSVTLTAGNGGTGADVNSNFGGSLTLKGGAGGTWSNPVQDVNGGNAGAIAITGQNGGNGTGTGNGGNGGSITITGGTGGTGTAAGSPGNITLTDSIATGTTTSSAFVFTANSLSSGTGLYLSSTGTLTGTLASMVANSMTSGTGLAVTSSGTAVTGDLGKFELTGNSGSSLTGNALKVGITGTTASGNSVALNVTNGNTGSTAYVARFNDDGTYTDSTPVVIDGTGQVGIGLTAPSQKLHVSGGNLRVDAAANTGWDEGISINASTLDYAMLNFHDTTTATEAYSATTIKWGLVYNNTAGTTGAVSGGLHVVEANTANKVPLTIAPTTDNVGIMSVNPDKALEVNSATGVNLRLTYNDNNGSAANYTDFSLSTAGALTITGSAATLADSATAEKTYLTLTPGTTTLTGTTTVTSVMDTAIITGATIAASAATTVNDAAALTVTAPVDSTNATLTRSQALRIADTTSGAGTLTSLIGLYIEPQTGGATNNIGICFDCDGTWTSSTVASGIQFGSDANSVNLYRSASDTLRTDDALSVGSTLTVTSTLTANGDVDIGDLSTDTLTITSVVDSDLTFIKSVDRTISIATSTSGVGGALTIQAGTGASGQNGGALTLKSGAGQGSGQDSGAISISTPSGLGTGDGGNITISAGKTGGSPGGEGGDITITGGGASDDGTQGTGGTITITAGSSGGGTTGGTLALNGGANVYSGTGGAVEITSGVGGGSGASGTVTITTANETSAASGALTISTGTTTTSGNSGDITIKTGTAASTAGTLYLGIGGSNELTLTATDFSPSTDGGNALGTTTLGWNGLHLNTGTAINWENGDVTLTHAANTLTLAGATSGYVFNDGNVYINDTSNANITLGLTINQGANDDQILAFKSSDVAHGVTDIAETDTYGYFTKPVAASGGLDVIGLTEAAIGLALDSVHTTDDTTKSTSANASVILAAHLKSGTGLAALGMDGNILAIRDRTTTQFIFDKEGDFWLAGDIESLGGTEIAINESSADVDFRIESNGNANAFVLDAGLFSNVGQISIGSAAQGTATAFTVIDNPAITATSNQNFYKLFIDNSAAVTVSGATTSTVVASLAIDEPNIIATGTVTNAASLYISGLPTEGSTTNSTILLGKESDHSIRIEGSTGSGTVGGALTIVSGAATAGNANGGAINITSGAGNGTNAVSGAITISTGATNNVGGGSSAFGDITIRPGTNSASPSQGGTLYLAGSPANAGGTSTNISITAGTTSGGGNDSIGGAITITAGTGSSTNNRAGGAITITTGAANGSGASGALSLATGNSTSGTAANVSIDVGTSGSGNGSILIGTAARAQTITLGSTSNTAAITVNSAVATGTTTSSAFAFNANFLTSGTGLYAASSTLTSGKLVDLQVSGTAAAASQTALNILTAGANGTNAITTYGAQISNTHTNATSGTNVALYLNASGATTANYGLIVNAGNVGIGTATPTEMLHVQAGTGDTNRTTVKIGNGGWAAPASPGSSSNGDKIIFYDDGSGEKHNLGLEVGHIWFQSLTGFKWYLSNPTAIEMVLTASALSPGSAQGNSLGSSSLEWEQLFLGDDNGINFGLDDDFTLGYDETTDDRLELTASAKNFAIALTTGQVIISGSAEGTTALSLTAGNLVLTAGDLAVNGDDITSDGTLTIDAATDIVFDADGADLIFKDAGTTIATFTNSSTDLTLDIAGSSLLLADGDVISIGGAVDAAYNVIGDNATNVSSIMGSDDDLYIEGNLEVDTDVYVDAGAVYQGVYGTDDDLILYLPFSEGTGGTAYDHSPYGWDGTLVGSQLWTTSKGKYGTSLDFDGTGDYITTSLVMPTTNFTVEFWVYPETVAGAYGDRPFGAGDSASGTHGMDYVLSDNTNAIVVLRDDARAPGSKILDFSCGTKQTANTWEHVVIIVDSTNGATCYRNAISRGTNASGTSMSTGSIGVNIGSSGDNGAEIDGVMDEILIYKRVLSAAEVKSHYLRGRNNTALTFDTTTTNTTLYGLRALPTTTGVLSSGTRNTYGLYSAPAQSGANDGGTSNLYGSYLAPSSTNSTTGSTVNVYGSYISTTGTLTTGGTINQYGLYVADGTSATTGTSAKYGVYIAPQTGADAGSNYGLCFDCDGTFGTQTVATGIQWGTDSTTTNNIALFRSANGTATLELGDGTDLIAASATAFNINLSDTATYTEWLCHNSADGATGVVDVGDCNQAGAGDLGEYYGSDGTLEAGDLVVTDSNKSAIQENHERYGQISKAYVTKNITSYQPQIIGIISTNPVFYSLGKGALSENDKPVVVALAGRVPIKVSTENGPILVGDALTSSSTPGVAMKATKAGVVIGKALEAFSEELGTTQNNQNSGVSDTSDSSGTQSPSESFRTGKIMVFVNVGWYDPDIYLTDTGNLNIVPSSTINPQNSNLYTLTSNINGVIDRIGAFGGIIVATVKSGLIQTQELFAEKKIVSPLVETNEIRPASGSADLIVDLTSGVGSDSPEVATDSAFGKLLVKGGLEVSKDATVAGTLRASKIIADEIIGATLSAQYITNNITNVYNSTSLTAGESTPSATPTPTSIEEIQKLLAQVKVDQQLMEQSAQWSTNPDSIGAATTNVLGNLATTGSIYVGTDLVIQSLTSNIQNLTSINTLSAPLSIQSLAAQPLSIMGDKILIATNGDVVIRGNVNIEGQLAVNELTHLPNQDLTISLGALPAQAGQEPNSPEASQSAFGKLLIKGVNGETVGSIDASGSAQFKDLATQKLVIATDNTAIPSGTISPNVIETNATAGQAVLEAGYTNLVIRNPHVSNTTLVYVTPTSSTQNQVLYVKTKQAQTETEAGYFVVGLDSPASVDITFNYWIIDITQ